MTEVSFSLPLAGFRLAGVLHLPEATGPRPLAVISHGLFSSMASPKLTLLARELAAMGLAAARFDSRGLGLSTGLVAETTLSGRIEEIRAVRDFLLQNFKVREPVALIGSSFGGTASLLLAKQQPAAGFLVVAWSAPSNFKTLKKDWSELEEKKLDQSFLEDLEKYSMPDELAGLGRVLLVHGQADEVVPASQAAALFEILGQPKRLKIIPGADHRLTSPLALGTALAETKKWLAEHHFCCHS